MKKNGLSEVMVRNVNRFGLHIKKHSPEILVVAGIAGFVTSTVMACKATTKVNDILEEAKANIDSVHEVVDKQPDVYSEKDKNKALAVVYARTGVKLAKLYGPSIVIGALSATSILTSNNIHRGRNVALAAAYTAVDTGFKQYRGRVIERFGKELDTELRHNIKAMEVEEVVTDDKGESTVVKKTVDVADPNAYSIYARCFDDGCKGWEKDAEYNLVFLRQVQSYMNDKLRIKGHVFLNEVYDELGIPRTKAGNIVGWIYDEKNPNGDNFIDFGIYDLNNPKSRDFVNGYERSIWLDFNVDGDILNLI